MAATDLLPGESSAQYAQRMGMSGADTSAFIASQAAGNGGASTPDAMNNYVKARATPPTPGQLAMAGGNSSIFPGAVKMGPTGQPLDPSFYGGYGADSVSGAARRNGGGIVNSATPAVQPTNGTTMASPTGGPGPAPGAGNNPNRGYVYTPPGPNSDAPGYGSNPNQNAATGNYGQPSNLAYGGTGPSTVPPGGIVNGATTPGSGAGNPNSGVPSPGGAENNGNGLTGPGSGLIFGNSTPTIGTPGQPGYQAPGVINPNLVNTTAFPNPNVAYDPTAGAPNPNQTATGGALNDPNAPPTADINAQTGAVKQTGPDAGTVQGQLDNLLSTGNPVLDAAKARAVAAANARGLQNTSMAAQAGEEAVVNAAVPIATSDAATFQNQNLVNQNITNQFLSQKEGANLNLQAAYQAFKQNNYAFDKSAQLQQYISDSNVSSTQKIAALQAAVSQANVMTQVQGTLAQTGMSLNSQLALTQMGFTQQDAVNLFTMQANNLTNYVNAINTINSSQSDPAAKAAELQTINAIYMGTAANPLLPNGISIQNPNSVGQPSGSPPPPAGTGGGVINQGTTVQQPSGGG